MDDQPNDYQRAVLSLLAELVARTEGATKPEILLGRAGLNHKEIAEIVGKKQPAVSKMISRDRLGRKDNGND